MLGEGHSCEQTLIPYTPTVTACGHSAVYTGTVPAINGITGNAWWDGQLRRTVYCTEDKSVSTVGSSSSQGKMSPKNLLVTSIADELRLATNFQGKVIGVAIKDRGAILPTGTIIRSAAGSPLAITRQTCPTGYKALTSANYPIRFMRQVGRCYTPPPLTKPAPLTIKVMRIKFLATPFHTT